MFYENRPRIRSARRRAVRFGDFSSGLNTAASEEILPLAYAKSAYNFSVRDGALKDGPGVTSLLNDAPDYYSNLASPIKKVWYFRRRGPGGADDSSAVVWCGDKNLYYAKFDGTGVFYPLANSRFESAPLFVNYRLGGSDCLIVSSASDEMLVWDGVNAPRRVPAAPKLTSITIHCERLFAIAAGEPDTLWFSGELDPTSWAVDLRGAGFIQMPDERGALRKVVSFLDYVYIFRDYGITRVSASGDQSQFSVAQLFVCSGKINADTVAVCGDRILFLASDGLYSFDGFSTVKIMRQFARGLESTESAAACFSGNKYYLACRYGYNDGDEEVLQYFWALSRPVKPYENNTVIEIDISDNTASFLRGADAADIAAFNTGDRAHAVIAVRQTVYERFLLSVTDDGCLWGLPAPKKWHTGKTGFGADGGLKTLKEIDLVSKSNCYVTVDAGVGGVRSFFAAGSPELRTIAVNMRGRRFSFTFESNEKGADISNVTAKVVF